MIEFTITRLIALAWTALVAYVVLTTTTPLYSALTNQFHTTVAYVTHERR